MKNRYSKLNPVFISGTPRSGTTLLYRTLLKHTSFQAKKLNLEETKVFLQPFLAVKSVGKPKPFFSYMLGDESAYQQYLDSITFEKFIQELFKKLRLSIILSEENHWQFVLNDRVARKYFFYAKQARGCKRIVEKTPKHLLWSDRIFKTYPHSKIIVTTRHPVDVFSSYKKRKRVETNSKWLDITVDEFVERYSKMVNHVEKLTHQQKALCVKYEDFISNPQKEFKNICEYLNEPYEADPVMEPEPRLEHWKSDPYLSKPITDKTKDWSDYIASEKVEIIESRLENEMEKFGYQSKLVE